MSNDKVIPVTIQEIDDTVRILERFHRYQLEYGEEVQEMTEALLEYRQRLTLEA